MIPVKIGELEFGIQFSHSKIARYPETHLLAGKPIPKREMTQRHRRTSECRLMEVFANEDRTVVSLVELSTGVSKCSLDDNFCKATGRHVALDKALRNARKSGHPLFTSNSLETARAVEDVEMRFYIAYGNRDNGLREADAQDFDDETIAAIVPEEYAKGA